MSKWAQYRVGDHVTFLSGFPFSSDYFDQHEGIRLIRIRDLLDPQGDRIFFRGDYDARWLIKPDDVLIGMDGEFNVVRWRGESALLNQRILKASVRVGSDIAPDYFYYWCGPYLKKVEDQTPATTVKHLSVRDVEKARLLAPPIPQQRRIAEILATVDEAIEGTEALIAKQQQVKAGLMHDLFTRGLTPDGKLRPPRSEAPDLYHKIPLGWLPKEWSWASIDGLLAKTFSPMRSGPFGSALLKEELVETGIPLLGIDNVFVEHFEPTFRRFVSPRKFTELIRYSVFPGDVIITIMGTVGRCCVVPDTIEEALSSKHLWTMTFDREQVIPELICWQLNHAPWVKRWFARHAQGAVMEAIQSSTLRELILPLPPINEQKLMAQRYSAATTTFAAETTRLSKLRQQKQGLMQDLLTGRVPVAV